MKRAPRESYPNSTLWPLWLCEALFTILIVAILYGATVVRFGF